MENDIADPIQSNSSPPLFHCLFGPLSWSRCPSHTLVIGAFLFPAIVSVTFFSSHPTLHGVPCTCTAHLIRPSHLCLKFGQQNGVIMHTGFFLLNRGFACFLNVEDVWVPGPCHIWSYHHRMIMSLERDNIGPALNWFSEISERKWTTL